MFKIFSPSGSHTILIFPYQTLLQYSDRDPPMGALNAGRICKNCFSQRISGFRINDWWSAINSWRSTMQELIAVSVDVSLLHQQILFITASMDDYAKYKSNEQNLIVCSSKSETTVTNIKRLRSTYCNNECICKAQNKWSSDALHHCAGVESFQFPCTCLNWAGRRS